MISQTLTSVRQKWMDPQLMRQAPQEDGHFLESGGMKNGLVYTVLRLLTIITADCACDMCWTIFQVNNRDPVNPVPEFPDILTPRWLFLQCYINHRTNLYQSCFLLTSSGFQRRRVDIYTRQHNKAPPGTPRTSCLIKTRNNKPIPFGFKSSLCFSYSRGALFTWKSQWGLNWTFRGTEVGTKGPKVFMFNEKEWVVEVSLRQKT